MRRPLIVGNWKMFKTVEEAVNLVEGIKAGVYKVTDCTVVVCPPFTALAAVSKVIKDSPIELGGQNMHPESEGAYTGEVSGRMLVDYGCHYVLVGHSERRTLFKEDLNLIPVLIKEGSMLQLNKPKQIEISI